MTNLLSKNELMNISEQKRKEVLKQTKCKYPHCEIVSKKIINEIIKSYEITTVKPILQKYKIDEITHYTVFIPKYLTESGEDLIIDASFDQFCNESEVPIDICPSSNISKIVISTRGSYIFSDREY